MPDKKELAKAIAGEPFAFFVSGDAKEDKHKNMWRNRVCCIKAKNNGEGIWLYVSLFMGDLGNKR